jgi:hypothetical protein
LTGSIIGKLFGKRVSTESCEFRLATNEGVDGELRAFAYKWGDTETVIDLSSKAAKTIRKRLSSEKPTVGTSWDEYIERFGVEIHSSDIEEMEAMTIREIGKFAQREGRQLVQDEVEKLYRYLYMEILDASTLPLTRGSAPERIERSKFKQLVLKIADQVSAKSDLLADLEPAQALEQQFRALGLPGGALRAAADMRRDYLFAFRTAGLRRKEALKAALEEVRLICFEETLFDARDPGPNPARELFDRISERVADFHRSGAWDDREVSLPIMRGMLFHLIACGYLEA